MNRAFRVLTTPAFGGNSEDYLVETPSFWMLLRS